MDAEMTAPTEAAVIATVSIESAKRSRMRASLCCWHHCSGVLLLLRSLLLERIVFNAHEIRRVVLGCRVRAAPFRMSEFLQPRSPDQPWMAVISLDAAGLVIEPVLLVALSCELLLDGPGPGPHGRVFDPDHVFKRVRPGSGPALADNRSSD